MRLITVILLSLLVGWCTGALPRLGEVFQVDMRDPDRHLSSCARRLDPNDPQSQLFDPNADPKDRTHILNAMWYWVNAMVHMANVDSQPDIYEVNWDVRKLLCSFFGIRQARRNQPQDPFEPHPATLDGRKLEHTGTENALDRDGNAIKKENSNDYYTLREWEEKHGRNFDQSWYFWMDVDGDRGYLLETKEDPTSPIPWPLDPRTNKPNYCLRPGAGGMTWFLRQPRAGMPGTDAWMRHKHIVICPMVFRKEHEPYLDPQPRGVHVDRLDVSARLFFHELVHLARPRESRDHKTWYPVYPDPRRPEPDPRWPAYKIGFDQARRYRPNTPNIVGAMQSMTLSMFEVAYPETTVWNALESIIDPEPYAWFALIMLMRRRTGQDWSTGAARPGGSPYEAPTAEIPYAWPPMKARTTTDSASFDEWPFEWDDVELNVTSTGWRNTTKEVGPITSFDEWTTFVTSVKAGQNQSKRAVPGR
ncbi:hypothetical protein PRZ48_000631 [Zasmidium cellare]|uniref:Uncharacterized protein n=1 Tax=Zasmidium cellare TaxID=395010 RepID=A0ABR0F099_ZASCE|nr:hypothetical protein PRZ48_000631 [Zasmidium cellare]